MAKSLRVVVFVISGIVGLLVIRAAVAFLLVRVNIQPLLETVAKVGTDTAASLLTIFLQLSKTSDTTNRGAKGLDRLRKGLKPRSLRTRAIGDIPNSAHVMAVRNVPNGYGSPEPWSPNDCSFSISARSCMRPVARLFAIRSSIEMTGTSMPSTDTILRLA